MDPRQAFNAMLAAALTARTVVQSVAPGLSPTRMVQQVGVEMGRMAVQGRAELAQALFSQSNAYVPYGAGQQLNAQQIRHQHQMIRRHSL
jgi:hypothetical protein